MFSISYSTHNFYFMQFTKQIMAIRYIKNISEEEEKEPDI